MLLKFEYSSSIEENVIRSTTDKLWQGVYQDLPSPLSQNNLLLSMTPLNQERIHRLLARALLYCGSFEDTKVYSSTLHPSYYTIIINMEHIPGTELPLGRLDDGTACSRLAILFHWASNNTSKWHQENVKKYIILQLLLVLHTILHFRSDSRRVRTISTSLELEIKMLRITNMFAVVICP